MKTLLFLAFILCTASVALAIKCKNCVSSKSMEDCKEREESVDCDSVSIGFVADRCVKMSYEYSGIKSFGKTCYSKQLCEQGGEAFKNCKQISNATCEMSCCDSNYCNSGTAPLVSAFLMIVCALTSFYLC
ncbi:PREDICTED: uncharacterized protein LOC107327465 isoform X1 [Acropora digitifera]|uniref:uncharacterized protein LOC107327465 isoform X1 n=1 Tax=Acropora digitifera TaxID=70779 RepID=UPI00077AEB82|nr:PREDICTED: uncharacterized protein LOC107327465 isoform X1 [Acropora digitifera]